MIDTTLCEVLKIIRIINKVTVKGLARKINVSPTYVSQIEELKRKPSFSIIEKYSNNFSIPVFLIIGISEKYQNHEITNRDRLISLDLFYYYKKIKTPAEILRIKTKNDELPSKRK